MIPALGFLLFRDFPASGNWIGYSSAVAPNGASRQTWYRAEDGTMFCLPTGYQDLVRAGQSLTGTEIISGGRQPSDAELAAFVESNRAVVEETRHFVSGLIKSAADASRLRARMEARMEAASGNALQNASRRETQK